MEKSKLIARINGNIDIEGIKESARYFDHCGADELFYYDEQSFLPGKEEDIKTIQAICRHADIPLNVCAKVKRFEDVKKMIYAGARRVFVATDEQDNLEAVEEASERFGAERIFLYLDMCRIAAPEDALLRARKAVEEEGFGGIVLAGDFMDNLYVQTADYLKVKMEQPVWVMAGTAIRRSPPDVLKMTMAQGLILMSEKMWISWI